MTDEAPDWSAMTQQEMAEFAHYEGGGWSNEPPAASLLLWQFAWVRGRDLLRAMTGATVEAWREWWAYEVEPPAVRGDGYLVEMEKAWLTDPLKPGLGPILVVRYADGTTDIGDGWHRAAISVLHDMPRVPIIVADVPETLRRAVSGR